MQYPTACRSRPCGITVPPQIPRYYTTGTILPVYHDACILEYQDQMLSLKALPRERRADSCGGSYGLISERAHKTHAGLNEAILLTLRGPYSSSSRMLSPCFFLLPLPLGRHGGDSRGQCKRWSKVGPSRAPHNNHCSRGH